MNALIYLIPIALLLGAVALLAFWWCLRNDQYEDMEGDKYRILDDEEDEGPLR
jgi:cbb3-type cytochrome oxidase maturation protein